jgi:hypothetical protein
MHRRLALGAGAALALAWLTAAPALAQKPEEFMRPCRRNDLIGVWRVMRMGVAPGTAVDRTHPDYQPHQRFVFHSNATMAYLASPTPFEIEQDRALAKAPGSMTWAIEDGGRLVRQADGAARVEASECYVMTRAVRDPRGGQPPARPGDLLLTDQGDDERPMTRRLLRRLSSAE